MTEIKLSTEDHDIQDLIRYLNGDHHMSVFDRQYVVKTIEAQLPKTDPVEALVQEYARRDWDATSADEDSTTWRYFITPSRLREFAAEVLRIGVGAECNHQLQQLRDILLRSPSGEMTNREGAEAYKALRREIGILLAAQTDEGAGALPDLISPGSGVATSPPVPSSPTIEGSDAYLLGMKDACLYLRKRLIQLRSSAITAERQDAYDKAIAAVEAMS